MAINDTTQDQTVTNPSTQLPVSSTPSPQLSYIQPPQPADNALLRIIGKVRGKPFTQPGPAMAVTNVAPDPNLSSSLGLPAPSPVGTDAQGKPLYNYAEMSKHNEDIATLRRMQAVRSVTNPDYNKDQLIALGVDPEQAETLSTLYNGHVPQKAISTSTTISGQDQRSDYMNKLADARAGMVTNAVLNTALKYGGAGAVQHLAGEATNRLGNISRAQALVDQINSQGGSADVRQRTELAASLARTLNPSGVMTNEALNLFVPTSLKGKFGTFGEYLTNESQPVDFTGFMPKLQGLLDREKGINQELVQNAQSMGQGAMQNLQNVSPSLAKTTQQGLQNNPLINPQANTPATKPVDTTGRVTMIKPDGSMVAVAAKDVVRARAKGYRVQ